MKGIFQLYEITVLFLLEKLNREMQLNIIHRELFSAGSHVSGGILDLTFKKYLSLLLCDSDIR